MTAGLQVERVDPGALDLGLATELAALISAGREQVPTERPTGESFLLDVTLTDEPAKAWWLARIGGSVVGMVELNEPEHEYTDAAFLGGVVHPDHQRSGIGNA